MRLCLCVARNQIDATTAEREQKGEEFHSHQTSRWSWTSANHNSQKDQNIKNYHKIMKIKIAGRAGPE